MARSRARGKRMVKQIPTESIRKYTKEWIQERGFCPWSTPLNGEKYCHFIHWDYCPYDRMEKEKTVIRHIPERVFYRCLL